MRIKDITTAKRNFDNAMENLGQKFTTTCYNFVVELRGAIDGDEDWSVIEARAFGKSYPICGRRWRRVAAPTPACTARRSARRLAPQYASIR